MRKRGRVEREGSGGLEVQIRKGGGGERWGGNSLERDGEERGGGIRTIFGMEIPYINFSPNQQNQIQGKAVLFAIISGASYYQVSWFYPFKIA